MQSELHGNVVHHGVEVLLLVSIVVKACLPEAPITCRHVTMCHVTMCSATLSRTFDTCIYKRSPPPFVTAAVVVQ